MMESASPAVALPLAVMDLLIFPAFAHAGCPQPAWHPCLSAASAHLQQYASMHSQIWMAAL